MVQIHLLRGKRTMVGNRRQTSARQDIKFETKAQRILFHVEDPVLMKQSETIFLSLSLFLLFCSPLLSSRLFLISTCLSSPFLFLHLFFLFPFLSFTSVFISLFFSPFHSSPLLYSLPIHFTSFLFSSPLRSSFLLFSSLLPPSLTHPLSQPSCQARCGFNDGIVYRRDVYISAPIHHSAWNEGQISDKARGATRGNNGVEGEEELGGEGKKRKS